MSAESELQVLKAKEKLDLKITVERLSTLEELKVEILKFQHEHLNEEHNPNLLQYYTQKKHLEEVIIRSQHKEVTYLMNQL